MKVIIYFSLLAVCLSADMLSAAELPPKNTSIEIAAQAWPHKPGPRTVRVKIHYPGGKLANVTPQTGVMLTLHNWGGTDCVGTANPNTLANRLNVIAICVNYLQSGRKASVEDPKPYDCGYLQALDALRALHHIIDGLQKAGIKFDDKRLFCTGGSGGGNVTLMANKLAPRTFACVIDMCGMKKLSNDIAFNLPGGTGLNARWSRDPKSKNYLSSDHQEIRFVGHPDHLLAMKKLGHATKIIVVHGTQDTTCPFADAEEMVTNMRAAGLDVVPHFLTKKDLDGKVFTSTGHALGNRSEIPFRVAGKYLNATGPQALRRKGPSDFERQENIIYKTTNGKFVISYKAGYPIGKFEPNPPAVPYKKHNDLSYYLDRNGNRHKIKSADDWAIRQKHILENMQLVMGKLPGIMQRVPLDVQVTTQQHLKSGIQLRKITFQSDSYDRVPAWILFPAVNEKTTNSKHPGILCLHQTVKSGKDEPVGLTGKKNMHYALELAKRGYVVIAPDYPSLGEHNYQFEKHPEYASGTMKAIWDNMRAVDLLQNLPEVDPQRIGVIGHSLGGHNAIFTAAFEPRIKVIASSCGFSTFHKDDVPSWTGPRYMTRIATVYQNDADRVPFDFNEIIASLAPRPFIASAAVQDSDFDVTGVKDVMQSAGRIYRLLQVEQKLKAIYPETPHDFPPAAREKVYQFIDQHLKR